MQPTSTILLTGATGTVGTEIINLLADKENIRLTVFDKKTAASSKFLTPFSNRINIIFGDLYNENDIGKIPKNIDVTIHLAAIIPPLADEKPKLTYNVNVIGTKNLIKQLEATSPNTFLLYSSSISVYGDRVMNPDIVVSDPLNPSEGDLYGQSKIEAEELIKKSRLDWTIFRLTAIMKNHKISKLMFHMPLTTILEICTPKDTAKAFVEAIYKRKELSKQIFNLGGGEKCRMSYENFLEKSFHLFGLGKLNFPPNTFAKRNFHCGAYVDGHKLEDILHFRSDTLDSYFAETKLSVPFLKKICCRLLRVAIKRYLSAQSEPLKAFKENDKVLLKQFF